MWIIEPAHTVSITHVATKWQHEDRELGCRCRRVQESSAAECVHRLCITLSTAPALLVQQPALCMTHNKSMAASRVSKEEVAVTAGEQQLNWRTPPYCGHTVTHATAVQ